MIHHNRVVRIMAKSETTIRIKEKITCKTFQIS